jgi:hypothetical protein
MTKIAGNGGPSGRASVRDGGLKIEDGRISKTSNIEHPAPSVARETLPKLYRFFTDFLFQPPMDTNKHKCGIETSGCAWPPTSNIQNFTGFNRQGTKDAKGTQHTLVCPTTLTGRLATGTSAWQFSHPMREGMKTLPKLYRFFTDFCF